MKKLFTAKPRLIQRTAALLAFLSVSIAAHAQAYNKDEYSRGSLGLNVGVPFFWGDLNSFSAEKTYIGLMGGVQAGYQVSPVVGFGLTLDYGQGKLGTRDYSKGFFLGNDGNAYCCPPLLATGIVTKRYDEIYAKTKFFSAGLFADFNLNRIFSPSKDPKRWTALAGPAIYLQQYTPKVYDNATGNEFTQNSGKANDPSLSLGANFTLRYRAGRTVDLQWKNSGLWLADKKFDGVSCGSKENANFAWYSTVGIVFKLNGKGKKDNLMYARRTEPTPAPAPIPVATPAPPAVKEEIYVAPPKEEPKPVVVETPKPVVAEAPKPIPTVKNDAKYTSLPKLGAVYFNRGQSEINTERFANELKAIVDAANKYPKAKMVIRGFTDHVGTEEGNKELAVKRIEAMEKYLNEHGIASERLEMGYAGMDRNLVGEKAYSEEARRVEVRLQNP